MQPHQAHPTKHQITINSPCNLTNKRHHHCSFSPGITNTKPSSQVTSWPTKMSATPHPKTCRPPLTYKLQPPTYPPQRTGAGNASNPRNFSPPSIKLHLHPRHLGILLPQVKHNSPATAVVLMMHYTAPPTRPQAGTRPGASRARKTTRGRQYTNPTPRYAITKASG